MELMVLPAVPAEAAVTVASLEPVSDGVRIASAGATGTCNVLLLGVSLQTCKLQCFSGARHTGARVLTHTHMHACAHTCGPTGHHRMKGLYSHRLCTFAIDF